MMGEVPSEIDLMAYADGELAAAAAERVRHYIAENDVAQAKVTMHRKLREAGKRAVAKEAVPNGLAERIQELAAQAHSGPSGRWRIGRAMAVAAVLVLGLGSAAIWSMFGRGQGTQEVVRQSSLVPVAWVTSAAKVHIGCSKHPSHFTPAFPKTLAEMPASLREFLGHDAKCPDLSKLGYQFAGCGPCMIPGGKTAHLLYRPSSGSSACVSLFEQADRGQLAIEQGKVYFARDDADATPMIVWKSDGVVYYLVGEENDQLASAAGQMGMKVKI
jgi:anti-sigma factor RsiW